MAETTGPIPSYFILMFIVCGLMSIVGNSLRPWTSFLPSELLSLDISTRFRVDTEATTLASTDFGKIVQKIPAAVLYPSSVNDIISLIKFSYQNSSSSSSHLPFNIAARGRGHSLRGQAMAPNGVVVNMASLNGSNGTGRIRVSRSHSLNSYYADVGGEQLWIDVLYATLERGLAPVSWTDYLYLTVGGTLSNAGISGQTFRYGPQINNVYEMDVVTGKGDFMVCSKSKNPELFYAVLGGLGQFGIITRARIALEPAPKRVKWVRMLYDDFSAFARDQEHLISIDGKKKKTKYGPDYVEGSLITNLSPPNNWRSSFFSSSNHSVITSLVTKHRIIYCLEVVKYYDDHSLHSVNEELQLLFKGMSFIPGFVFTKDVSLVDFLNRVRSGELILESKGLWDVPHPWLNLLVPKSRISDFNIGVFKGILLKQQNKIMGPVLVYPMNRNKWDERMSAVTPDEDIFYCIGFLNSSGSDEEWEALEEQNEEILQFCDGAGIQVKQYLPHYKTNQEWRNHFGSKWKVFQERKNQFDPKLILSPGQQIFN